VKSCLDNTYISIRPASGIFRDTIFYAERIMNIPFESSEFVMAAGGLSWHFSKPSNPDRLLDSLTEKQFEKDRFLPYWAELWPAAEVLFTFVAGRSFDRRLRICDLGCGLGAVASYLCATGHRVTALDISPDACVYARHNILRYGSIARVACIDWRSPPFKASFDIVIAADILYEQQCLCPVLHFLETCTTPQAQAFIADPRRAPWETFKAQIQRRGFTVWATHSQAINGGRTVVEVVHLRKTYG